jgi:hypothetical protein
MIITEYQPNRETWHVWPIATSLYIYAT